MTWTCSHGWSKGQGSSFLRCHGRRYFRPAVEPLEGRQLLSGGAFIRVNQVGYAATAAKHAMLMASALESGAHFNVLDSAGHAVYTAPIGALQPARWNTNFPNVYLLDFSAVTAIGTYSLAVTGPVAATSPSFAINTAVNLYSGLLGNALFFYQAQQDGPNVNPAVMGRQPSHLTDQSAYVYRTPTYSNDVLTSSLTRIGGPIDVSGGWFDAGDYLKFVETASYTDAIMLLAVRDFPTLLGSGGSADFFDQAKFGLQWLSKMWDDHSQTLFYQVGIGDGNSSQSIMGDHDVPFRLPQADDQLGIPPSNTNNPEYYIEYRPVFVAGPAGSTISPNLAGRLAAAFALGFQVYNASDPTFAGQCLLAAEHIFDLAKTTNVGKLLTTAPYDYYPETAWQDDLELGAAELYFAVAAGNLPPGLPHNDPSYYLQKSASWAHAYITSGNDASESLNLYDVSGLAHYELYHAIAQAGNPPGLAVTQAGLLTDLKRVLDAGVTQARTDPFGFGIAYGGGLDLVPHALGYALEASFYDELAGVATYASFGRNQLDWVFGDNAWGVSFVVGAGTNYPHCLHHQIANLYDPSGEGSVATMFGATVDGPSVTSNFGGLTTPTGADPCGPTWANNPYRAFSSRGVAYWDNVAAYPSVEPTDDYTVLTILVFARQVSAMAAANLLAGTHPPASALMVPQLSFLYTGPGDTSGRPLGLSLQTDSRNGPGATRAGTSAGAVTNAKNSAGGMELSLTLHHEHEGAMVLRISLGLPLGVRPNVFTIRRQLADGREDDL
jgi:endoglucanase